MNDLLNKNLVSGHEGLRLIAYRDTAGKLTVGRGFNLDAPGAALVCARAGVLFAAACMGHAQTPAQADAIFSYQYSVVAAQARGIFPKLDSYPDNAAAVVCDMLFELGLAGFLEFHNFIAAVRAGDGAAAIAAIHDSELYSEVPGRTRNNISLLHTAWPPTEVPPTE